MYRFRDCEVDPRGFVLRRGGDQVRVERQVFGVLVHLIEHRDRVVPKLELLDAVWGNRFVSESALTSRLKDARRAVGDDGHRQEVIARAAGWCSWTAATTSSPSTRPPGGPGRRGQPVLGELSSISIGRWSEAAGRSGRAMAGMGTMRAVRVGVAWAPSMRLCGLEEL